MSVWSGIKSLFSSGDIVEKVSSGVDKAWFTEQERSGHFGWLLKLYEPYKIAQRLLALIFCIPYALAWFITFGLSFAFDVKSQLALLSGDMAVIVGIIIGFYFGAGAVEGVIKSRRAANGI